MDALVKWIAVLGMCFASAAAEASYRYSYSNAFTEKADPDNLLGPGFEISINADTVPIAGTGNYAPESFSFVAGNVSCTGLACFSSPVVALPTGFKAISRSGLPEQWFFLAGFGSTKAYLGFGGPDSMCGATFPRGNTFTDCVEMTEVLSDGTVRAVFGQASTPGTWTVTAVPLPAAPWLLLSGFVALSPLVRRARQRMN